MNVFWRFGYEHTSLDVLMREMGIARQSLYDTFGDKRALYLQALTQYRDNDHARLRRLLPRVDRSKRASGKFCLVFAASRGRNTNEAAYCSVRIWSAMQKIKSSLSFC